ncbi:MAG: alanine--tRNA ligase [Chlamydiia bacterium]
MNVSQIREKFLKYFIAKGHTHVPSSPVIPQDDPTLLFANAGMNQFKDIFLGKETRSYTRATTSQKCIRAGGKHNDLDDVGYTSRHLTFFEMLGNFSFGDYFKKEAIQFAWEVSTEIFHLEPKKIFVSVFETDDEAFDLWRAHVPENQIVRFGAKQNFWAMGDTGPCGPCTELLYDRGERFSTARDPYEDESGERFLEFWNVVFMQYDKSAAGTNPLKKPSIDTGMGLERIAALKQGVDTVFGIDLFQNLIRDAEKIIGRRYADNQVAFHVIADHIRSLSFAIADGAILSNVDRGYVLRKILRRAVQFGRRLGKEDPFLHKMVLPLIHQMGETYPELKTEQSHIEEMILNEEEGFLRTLKRGGGLLQKAFEEAKPKNLLDGSVAFKLKDTYGIPFDELALMAKDVGIAVDTEGYLKEEERAKEISRKGFETKETLDLEPLIEFVQNHGATQFVGFDRLSTDATITGIYSNGQFVDTLFKGEKGWLILDETPFYAEKGGQIGDVGQIGAFKVEGTKTPVKGLIIHEGIAKETLVLSAVVKAEVDQGLRGEIEKNHTATHILHYALQQVAGPQVRQQGSFVGSNRLRFDFNSQKPLTEEELRQIEAICNEKIRQNLAVATYEIPYEEVKKEPKIKQFFQDKYDAIVRVVQVGDFSYELCGGTHVKNTGDILLLKVLKESSVASGVRRLEAICSHEALSYLLQKEATLDKAASLLKCQPDKTLETLDLVLLQHKKMTKELEDLKEAEKRKVFQALLEEPEGTMVKELPLELKDLVDIACPLAKARHATVFLYNENRFALATTPKVDAKKFLEELKQSITIKGGGTKEFVQGTFEIPLKGDAQLKHLRGLLEAVCC